MSSELLNLNEIEKRVYTILSVSGQLSLPELVSGTNLPYDEVKSIIDGLLQAGLIRQVPGLIDRYAVVLPLEPVARSLEEKAATVSLFPEKLNQSIKQSLESINERVQSLLGSLETEKQESITRGINTLQSKTTEVKDSVATSLKDVTSSTSDSLGTGKASVISKMQALSSSLKETIETTKSALERLKQEHENHVTSFASLTTKKTQDAIEAIPKEPESIIHVDEWKNRSLGEEEKTTGQHKAFLEKTTTDMIASYEKVLASLHSGLDSLSLRLDNITKSTSEWKNETQSFLQNFKTEIDEAITRFDQVITQEMKSTKEKFDDQSKKRTETFTGLKNSTDTINGKQKEKVDSIHAQFTQGIVDLDGRMKERVTSLSQEWETLLSNESTASKALEKTFKTNFDAMIQSIIQEFTSKSASLYESFTQSYYEELAKSETSKKNIVKNTVVSLHEDLENTKKALEEKLSELTEAMKQEIDSVHATFLADLQTHEETSKHYQDEEKRILEVLENTIQNMKQELLAMTSKTNELIMTSLDKQSQSLDSVLKEMKETTVQTMTNTESTVQGAIDAVKTQQEKLLQELEATSQAIKDDIEKTLSDIKTSLLTGHTETRNKLTELLSGYIESIDHLKKTNIEAVQSALSQEQERFEQTQNSFNDVITQEQSVIEGVFTQMNNELVQFQDKAISSVNTVFDEGVKRLETVLQGSLDSFLETTKKVVNENYSELETKLMETLRSASEITDEIKTVTVGLAQGLKELSSGQANEQPVKIMTSTVIGEKAVIEYMKDMTKRLKSRVTYLSPDKSFIPVEEILALPMTAQVTIVTSLDKEKDREWIKTLFKAKANVIIRQLNDKIGTGTIPNFIGCEREGEEILLGTIDDDSKETVAIVSMSSYFTKILANIVIAEYARGRSMQLQRSEFEA